ncbi:hypothetical protein GF386_00900 [Candidatus Pacearchaeota archaeon]|nr:hypothetical protein [Candidatus Pacearchaeota archaeon]
MTHIICIIETYTDMRKSNQQQGTYLGAFLDDIERRFGHATDKNWGVMVREFKLVDFIVPREKKKEFLEYLKNFEPEYLTADRYGQRLPFNQSLVFKMAMKYNPIGVDMTKIKRMKIDDCITSEGEPWFVYVYVLGVLEDGQHPYGSGKELL